ncbi:MAG TPA: ATP-binding protein [Longimicrobiales bacterium]|nr:ATP-binding protein [Longimicrobiales bacterium]
MAWGPQERHGRKATQPCPCGYQGHPRVPCRCPPSIVQRYRRRIGGPLLERIELRVEMLPPSFEELIPARRSTRRATPGLGGTELREQVEAARARQLARQGARKNAELDGTELDRWSPLEGEGRQLCARAARVRSLSARALQALRRVARTLADLEGEEHVQPKHLAQALALRSPAV